MVNTELTEIMREYENNYNILNIVVNTERKPVADKTPADRSEERRVGKECYS